ncbi:hypothetical protein ACWDWO_25025 [Actinopolymorpha singaporensis]
MTIAQQRSILERVARGEISPDDAERELASLDPSQQPNPSDPPVPPVPMAPAAPPTPATPATPAAPAAPPMPAAPATVEQSTTEPSTLTVHASLNAAGTIEVACDGEADDVWFEGPYRGSIERDGDNVHVEGQVGDDTLLVVPANAQLHLELNGGDALVRGLRGSFHGDFNVGDVRLEAELTEGESHLDANAGNVTVVLSPDSDVRVVVRCPAEYGMDDRLTKAGRGEYVLGEGTALLEIDGNLAEVSVRVG